MDLNNEVNSFKIPKQAEPPIKKLQLTPLGKINTILTVHTGILKLVVTGLVLAHTKVIAKICANKIFGMKFNKHLLAAKP